MNVLEPLLVYCEGVLGVYCCRELLIRNDFILSFSEVFRGGLLGAPRGGVFATFWKSVMQVPPEFSLCIFKFCITHVVPNIEPRSGSVIIFVKECQEVQAKEWTV